LAPACNAPRCTQAITLPSGCRFRSRCAFAEDVCAAKMPALGTWVDRASHLAACHMHDTSSCAGRAPEARGAQGRRCRQHVTRGRPNGPANDDRRARDMEPRAGATAGGGGNLTVKFVSREATVQAVNGIPFELAPGEVLCIIGESGSGKSVTMRALMRLLPKRRTVLSGNMRVRDHDILRLSEREITAMRRSTISMIFQEPMTALDPVYTIGDQIAETVVLTRAARTMSEWSARSNCCSW